MSSLIPAKHSSDQYTTSSPGSQNSSGAPEASETSTISKRQTLAPKPTASSVQTTDARLRRASASRKHASIACQQCQLRKKRCSGDQPCLSCIGKGLDCVFSGLDGRTHQARKRKTDDLHSDSVLLWDLLTTFRHSDDNRVNSLVKVMRTDAPVEEVKRDLKTELETPMQMTLQPTGRSGSFGDQSTAYGSVQKQARRAVFDVGRLSDAPPFTVPATPWTNVVSDDSLVSNLISLWLTWDKLRHDWIEETLFLLAMRSKDIDSPYCSRFLVNSILALATRYSDYEEATAARGTDHDLLLVFVDEAKRLLEKEVAPSLPLVQGLMMLWLAVCFIGHDKEAFIYLDRAVTTCRQLVPYSAATTEDAAHVYLNAQRKTVWGVFAAANEMSLLYKMPLLFETPQHSRPSIKADSILWAPYGSHGPTRTYNPCEIFDQLCNLALASQELVKIRQDAQSNNPLSHISERIDDLHDILVSWRDVLPDHLRPSPDANPAVFILHTNYHVIKMYLAEFIEDYDKHTTGADLKRANSTRLDAARCIADICTLQQSLYGSHLMCVYHAHPAAQALAVLVKYATTAEDEASIVSLCVFLRSMSRRWPLIMAILRSVQLDAEGDGKALPPAAVGILQNFEQFEWASRTIERVDSLYPATSSSATPDTTGDSNAQNTPLSVTDFLDHMDRLRLTASAT